MFGNSGFSPMSFSPLLGQNFMQQHQQQGQHNGGGFSPFMLSPMLGMFMSGHPNLGLGMISPALGISSALGLF